MEWLNFHHLLLFTTLVREGSLVGAGKALGLSHSTLSSQIHAFEAALGTKLLEREGRRLVPTDTGRVVVRYGEHDVMVPAAHGRWLAANVPNATVLVDHQAGHMKEPQTRVQELADLAASLG